jgi:hypothetical protein
MLDGHISAYTIIQMDKMKLKFLPLTLIINFSVDLLYFIISWRLKWMLHVARMGEVRNACTIVF